MRRHHVLFGILIVALSVFATGQAHAQESSDSDAAPHCAQSTPEIDPYRYARSLSLDLRGHLPSDEELAEIDRLGEVPEAFIDAWLDTDEFALQVARLHRRLLWNNVEGVDIISFQRSLGTVRFERPEGEPEVRAYYRGGVAETLRGSRRGCIDQEHTEFGPNGEVIPVTETLDADGRVVERLDGYIDVNPYWAPDTTIKVCAFDAQTHMTSPLTGRACDRNEGNSDLGCGCGPNLNWCTTFNYEREIMRAMSAEVEHRIATIIRERRPYTDLFESQTAYLNGKLSHFWRHLRGVRGGTSVNPAPMPLNRMPAIAWNEDAWTPIQLDDQHAGILTSVPYLLRFQTNRARANQFFTMFMCSPFQAPPGGLPVSGDRAAREPDLQQREGCKYCHALLEPAAAHWGRWSEMGAGYLHPEEYPAYDADCARCAGTSTQCTDFCSDNYVTRTLDVQEQPYLGWLKPFLFRYEEHRENIEAGPRALVADTLVDNRLLGCTVRTIAEHILGRPIFTTEQAWLDDMTRRFVESNYDYREVVKAIVTSPAYRRVQ